MLLANVILIHLIVLSEIHAQQNNEIPNSPCPNIFQYKYNGNEWYGEITLPSPPIQHREVVLHLTLSLRAATAQNNIGTINIAHTAQEATNRIINRQPLTFHVSFPYRYPIPKLSRVVYDENLLCTGPEEQPNPQTAISRIELKHVMDTYTTYQPSSINNQYDVNQIGNQIGNQNGFQNGNQNGFQNGNQNGFQNGNQNGFQNGNQNGFQNGNPYGTSTIQNNYPIQNSFPQNSGSMPPILLPPPFMMSGLVTTSSTTTTARPTSPSKPQSPEATPDLDSVCGTRYTDSEITPLVFGGEDTKPGEWPWMVAIYLNKPTGLSFNCGGSLISSRSVITAAHCINTSTKNYRPHEVVLYLGRYSLIDWSEIGSVSTNVEEIIIHTDYKRQRESFDADIAILIMTKRVEFNEYVRPVCVWPPSSNIQEIEGRKGTVVGWGKDGTDRVVSNIPKKVDLPIVNSITCVQTSESLSKAVSNRTFCAGTLNGDGPCHGDSGGGLTLYRNNRWSLRGIVSAGLSDANTGACKLMDYVVFTDVSLFSTWIKTYIHL